MRLGLNAPEDKAMVALSFLDPFRSHAASLHKLVRLVKSSLRFKNRDYDPTLARKGAPHARYWGHSR